MPAGFGFKAGPGESKWHNTGVGAVWAVKRLLKRAIDFYIRSMEDWLQRVAKIIAQPGTQEADMAPKAARNFGDKGEGARITHAGKDSGDAGFTGRRPVSGVTQREGKNTGGTAKEEVATRKIGKSKKSKKGSDWSKDGGDKFHSLTEDSESISSGCNQSATVGSTLSESESASSAAESNVRQQRRQRRSTKIQTDLTGGAEPAGQSTKALKWDYLGIRLTGSENVPASDSPPNVDGNLDGQTPNTSATSTDTRLLQIMYDMIKEVQTKTRAESRRA
ncbi:hypothetical protein NDU88_000598 [Pleurodeles waltl]|uniref:Uncharacterized protein n=1 Tax=Pleurodeles waltl TaxID=8319 RepID=A0AAV7NBT5_PLEWA|nr:hypothetical protein NDU88_000598 [Pleurodeles waltl]